MVWQDGWAVRLIIIGGPDAMKTAIEKPVTPGGVFDHLMVPQGDEPEFHPSKDPKTMTMQEFLEEVDRFLCWNRMTPEEKRAEQEAQRAASHATEQAAGDIPCTMRPERVPDTPQDTVWEDLTDAPQDVVRADVLDTSMDGMFGGCAEQRCTRKSCRHDARRCPGRHRGKCAREGSRYCAGWPTGRSPRHCRGEHAGCGRSLDSTGKGGK